MLPLPLPLRFALFRSVPFLVFSFRPAAWLHRLSCIIIVASLTARELFKSHTEKWRKRSGGREGEGEVSGEVFPQPNEKQTERAKLPQFFPHSFPRTSPFFFPVVPYSSSCCHHFYIKIGCSFAALGQFFPPLEPRTSNRW